MEHLDVKIISLKKNPKILKNIREIFPQAEIHLASDFRSLKPIDLFYQKYITINAYDTLMKGRKWHKELTSSGAVGLYDSNRQALRTNKHKFLLLCEEDCVMDPSIYEEVRMLMDHKEIFDVAVFGPIIHGKTISTHLKNWHTLTNKSSFWGTHCVLYTPNAKEKLSEIYKNPLEIQIDSLLAFLDNTKEIRILLDIKRYATQSIHISNIQNLKCTMCSVDSNTNFIHISTMIAIITFLVGFMLSNKIKSTFAFLFASIK